VIRAWLIATVAIVVSLTGCSTPAPGRTSPSPGLDLTPEERRFLAAKGLVPIRDRIADDDLVWKYLSKRAVEGAGVVLSVSRGVPSAKGGISSIDAFRAEGGFPRMYVLTFADEPVDLSDASIDWGGGAPRCLSRFWLQDQPGLFLEGRRDLRDREVGWTREFREGGRRTAVYYQFHWDQWKPTPNLRHLFIQERSALLVIDYQD